MTLDPQLLAFLVCPRCKGPLVHRLEGADESLDCPRCALRYPVRDGIPIMLVDEASPLPPTA
jgi:hypothetical protein